MNKLLRYLAFALMIGGVYAQNNLPACQGTDVSKWSNCSGSAKYGNGEKYVGDFKDGKRWGLGTLTFPDGAKLVGEYQGDNVDTKNNTLIFPDGYTVKTVNGQSTHYPANKPESKTQQSDQELTTRNSLNQAINSFCKGKPRFLQTIAETIGGRIGVNPSSVTLDRVEIVSVSMWYLGMANTEPGSQEAREEHYNGCNGVFYTPKGPLNCNLHFNNNGIVTNICDR